MRKNILFATALLLTIFLSMSAQGSVQYSLKESTSGNVTYHFKIGTNTASWNFAEYNANMIAKTFDMSESWWVGNPPNSNDPTAKMNQVHALNPSYRALVYRDVSVIYSYWTDEWNLANSNGWLLKDSNGNYVTALVYSSNYLVDITNQSYQTWVANKIESWIQQYPFFDGVMCDNGLKYSEAEWESAQTGRPINPATRTYFTDDEISTGYAQLLNATIAAVGPSKLVLPNGIWNGEAFFGNNDYNKTLSQIPLLNALGSEGIFYQSYSGTYYTETKWKQSVDMVDWIQDNFLAGHPERMFNGWVPAIDLSYLPPATTQEQLMMFGFCSMMLCVTYSGQNTIDFGSGLSANTTLLTFVQRLRNIDMVEPLRDCYEINSTSVYARDFANGKVLVNPTGESYTVTLDAGYVTIDGKTVSGSLTIGGHIGVILLK